MVVGQSESSNSGEIIQDGKGGYDALIAKFDANGNKLWHKLYGGLKAENFDSLTVNSDGEVVVVGSTYSTDGDFGGRNNKLYGGAEGLVAKFNANGNVLWYKTIGGGGNDTNQRLDDTLLAKFSTNNIPTFRYSKFVNINVRDEYNPMNDLTVIDKEDGDLTSDVTNTTNVNVNQPGVYKTDYEVIDLERNKVKASQVVVVNDGTYYP